ncbi:MAG: hypothetical protein ABWZ26_01135 [Candidatus Nanopelagicales bacterium]
MPDDHRDRGGDPSQVHGQVTVRALVTGRDLQVEGTTLHIPQQRPVVVVRVGPEPGVDHEVGRAGKVTDLDQGLLLPPDLAEGLVGLDEVSGRVQEDQPLNTVGDCRRDAACLSSSASRRSCASRCLCSASARSAN